MDASARTACSFAPDRVVVTLADRRPKKPSPQKPLPPRRPDRDASNAFASKVELGANVLEALSAEAKCLRVPLPDNLIARFAKLEAELELIAHDVREAGGAA